MRIVLSAILWGFGGAVFGAINGLIIGWAVGGSLLEIGGSVALIVALFTALYRLVTPRRNPIPVSSVEQSKSRSNRYKLESCAWCQGSGLTGKKKSPQACEVCNESGTVLVKQPPQACPQCKGKGRLSFKRRCSHCEGAGWETYAHFE